MRDFMFIEYLILILSIIASVFITVSMYKPKNNIFGIELTENCKWGKIGDKGGWIEIEKMLSGDAKVYGDADLYGNAKVSGDAWVSGNARV